MVSNSPGAAAPLLSALPTLPLLPGALHSAFLALPRQRARNKAAPAEHDAGMLRGKPESAAAQGGSGRFGLGGRQRITRAPGSQVLSACSDPLKTELGARGVQAAGSELEGCCQGLVLLGETPGGASLVGSRGDGETLSPEMPKNEAAKAQPGTVWESLVPAGGIPVLLLAPSGAPEVRGIIPVCPHLLQPQAADLSLSFQVLLSPLSPSCSHTLTLCVRLPARPEGVPGCSGG